MKSYCTQWVDEHGAVQFRAQLTNHDACALPPDKTEDFFRGMALIARSMSPHNEQVAEEADQ